MTLINDGAKTFSILPLTPLQLPSNSYHFLALTLFTTLKGWGTGVSHLAGSASIPTHITLDR